MTRAANDQIIDGDCTAREFSSSPAEQRYLCAYCGRPLAVDEPRPMAGSSSPEVGAVTPQIDRWFLEPKGSRHRYWRAALDSSATSFGGFVVSCTAMYLCLAVSLWITLPISVLAAGFLIRIFIIQHDCGHGSFFRSRWGNELTGNLCSLMTLTPYALWRRQHARHHGSWNNLDLRAASGLDIYSSCMAIAEYRALGRWRRRLVRLTNHPIVANLLLPPLVFVILYRVPFDAPKGWRRERRGVFLTNLALAILMGGLGLALGCGRVAAIQLPIMVIASIIGVGLF